jgi:hypothetical protein
VIRQARGDDWVDVAVGNVRRAIRRYQNWEIGANPVHNDKETWQILEFAGANVSQEAIRRALLLIVAAGAGLPEYMLADGSNSNLASSRSQQLPASKKFEAIQEASRSRSYGLRVERVSYTGRVHGVELPRNLVFLVRRNG